MTRKILFTVLGIASGLFFANKVKAQQPSVSFVLTTQPCNNNGVLTANFTNLPTPINVVWHFPDGTSVTHNGVSTLSDALTGYSGVSLYITATSASPNMVADGYYQGSTPFQYAVSTTNAICPALGTTTATVIGGTAPYTYQWTNANTNTVISTSNPASLGNGQYHILITDANGCTSGSYNNVLDSIFVFTEAPFNFTINSTAANCTNGTATLGPITGSGVAPYSYQWSNGATSNSITGLVAGNYNLTVTDAQGCSRTRDKNVTQSVTIGANATVTPATCVQNNGSIITFGSGGVPPYSYLYSNGANTQTSSGLSSGVYSVTVTDANGCSGHTNAFVGASTPITATYTATPSSCTGSTGTAALTVSGGAAPYIISWATYPVQTGTTATGLAPGSYSFHITDANGCIRTGTVHIDPTTIISVAATSTDAMCTQSNGSISVLASGGTAPYTYLWSNNATTSSISSLAAGGYQVTVTDVNGCHTAVERIIYSNSPVVVGLSTTPASCIYSNDGAATSIVSGGASPYTYNWGGGLTTSSITGLGHGICGVYVTDANGCLGHMQGYVGYDASNTSCYCTITGKVYNDANGNCVMDAGEAGIPNIGIICSGFGSAYTDANGIYTFRVPSGTYTISEAVLATYPLAACQNNAVPITTVSASGCVQTVNFGNIINPLHDIYVGVWGNAAVPGNVHSQALIVSNQGSVTESAILAGYSNDGQLNSPSISPSGVFTNAGTNYYSTSGNTFPALAPGASTNFSVQYNVPTNIPLNTGLVFKDSAVYTSPMSLWVNDYSPWNNVNYCQGTVVSSFDPNFMEVNTQGEGAPGYITRNDSTLNYMVHFQNEGTYFAQNVVVVDTLDPSLDWKSLRPIYSSHKAAVTIDENGVLKYTFSNIQLPAKMNDDAGSNGMFVYSIKLKPNLPYGTQIKNDAGIYFDYNAPVATNSVMNTIKNPTSVGNVNNNKLAFSIYPNPAQSGFTAVIDNKVTNAATLISITDISGRVLRSKELKLASGKQLVAVSTDGLNDGIYFVNINVNGNKGTQKLVIVR
jgi:uncharacterized repeat protein (TIGR01451 family)